MENLMKKQIVGVLCIIIFYAFYSCSSEELDKSETTSPFWQNPYDFVGEYHNKGLLYVFQNLENDIDMKTRNAQTSLPIEKIQRLTESFCERNRLEDKDVQYFFDMKECLIFNSVTFFKTRAVGDNYSDKVQYYLNLFFKSLKNPSGVNSLDEFNQMISRYEQEVFQSNLTEKEKAIILVSYAVGRYSLKFWLDVSNTNALPIIKTRSESFSDWWSGTVTPAVAAIVEADITGAAAGAIEGAVAGATGGTVVAPGPGTVTGAVSGAVAGGTTGAIYGSAVGGVVYYFNH
ncbi:hypothetical protein SAMN05192581_10034 [Bacteroides ovatus]|uniref:Uncharacterized protein n=2 Tax=Bacteroides ovatus TaxID=28116 RepID=A0A1G6G0S5_BACOV|nr:hypothetical protein SAMN05192581_10034 [Bacteroides ovatus]